MSIKVEWKWTIPNVLSLVRIALVPVIAALYLNSNKYPSLLYWSFGALALSALSDALDGFIARRLHQITDIGKLLDPVADKLTQITVVLCVTIRDLHLLPLLIICVVKELCQSIGGLLLLRKGEKVRGAKWYGKVSTFVFYFAMALIVLWTDMPRPLFIGLIVLVSGWMLFAFFNYMRVFLAARRALPSVQAADGADETPKAG